MKLVGALIVFKTIPFFMSEELNSSTVLLASTFNYDFTHFPNIGKVIIWLMKENTKSFEPQIYYRNIIPKFESDKTYLLFTQSQRRRYRIYYWTGSIASLVAKKSAAKYALLLYLQLKENIELSAFMTISREAEFMETESFHNTVSFTEKEYVTDEVHNYYETVDELLPSKLPNLYIVRGESTTRIKAVPIGTKWLINDVCLVLVTGIKMDAMPPVNPLCGANVSDLTSLRTEVLSAVWNSYYKNDTSSSLGECTLQAFIEVLENIDNYKAYEVDDSNDHMKDADTFVEERDRSISFYRIYQVELTRWYPKPNQNIFALNHGGSIWGSELIDSASIAGSFLHIHARADNEEKQKGLEMAEEYLHNNYTLLSKQTRMRIKEVPYSPGNYPDFEINQIEHLFIHGLRHGDVRHW